MHHASAFLNALPPPAIDIPASVIVLTPDEKLDAPALEYKQAWLDFSNAKHFTDFRERLFALTGRTKGGNPDPEKRKEFDRHVETHFDKISALLTRKKAGRICGHRIFSVAQQSVILEALCRSYEHWPSWMREGVKHIQKK
jgi:hypothetical protein